MSSAALSAAAAATVDPATVAMVTYLTLFFGVLVGAIVPVIPTGALVSAAAAATLYSKYPETVVLVIIVASAAALIGDMALFAICSTRAGFRVLAWLRRRTKPDLLDRSHRQLDEHGIRLLIVSRLIPAGRIPVMAAALLAGMSWRWYLIGDAIACLAWSLTYAAIGILSSSIFDEPWKGILAAIGLVILVSVAPPAFNFLRSRVRTHG